MRAEDGALVPRTRLESGLSPRLLDYIYPNKVERVLRHFKFVDCRIAQFGLGQELWMAPNAKKSPDA